MAKPVAPKPQVNQPNPKANVNKETIYQIVKHSLNLAELVQLTVEGDTIVERQSLAKDIPAIVLAKTVNALRNQR